MRHQFGIHVAHVTAAALASENKSLAHPASVDSLPTSANQEDFVSMATFAARRLGAMNANTSNILAIELLAAAEGIEFHRPSGVRDRAGSRAFRLRDRCPVSQHADSSLPPSLRRQTSSWSGRSSRS